MPEERRVRYEDRKRVWLSLFVVACVAGMTIYVAHLQKKIDRQQTTIKREQDTVAQEQKSLGFQYEFIVESCIRLNILRAEDNVSHYADYKVFRIVLIESRASSRPMTAQEKQFQAAFLKQLASAVRVKSWTPLTNCREAVNRRGIAYRPPQPIPFVRQLPPKYDLYPKPNSSFLRVP